MNETFAVIAAAAAALAGGVYLTGKVWRFAKIVEALHGLAEKELTPNGGGSLHDKITRTDQALTDHLVESQRDRDRLAVVERHLGL